MMGYNKIEYKKLRIDRKFGVEIEISSNISKNVVFNLIKKHTLKDVLLSNYSLTNNNNYWHVKDDSTCGLLGSKGPKGVEIASYVGSSISDLNNISKTAQRLSFYGCKTNKNCGLHVHVEVKDFSKENIGVLLAHWIKLEPWIQNMIPTHRRSNKYCVSLNRIKPIHNKITWNSKSFFEYMCPKNTKTLNNPERRVSLNIINYVKNLKNSSHKSTIEFRYPESVLIKNDIKFWTLFFINFVGFCKHKNMPSSFSTPKDIDSFFNFCGIGNYENVFYIHDNNLFNIRNWVLERLLKYSCGDFKKQAQKKHFMLSNNFV